MRGWLSTMLAAVMGGGVTAAALLGAGVVDSGDHVTVLEPPLAPTGSAALAASASGGLSAHELYRRAAPGVVFVRAQTIDTERSPFDVTGGPPPAESTGSGFVLDEDGLILTNAHVIEAATEIRVTFPDQQTVTATPVGKDADTDLALLRVEPGDADLQPLELGGSDTVRVGDPVVAIGNPFGLECTLTAGAVSALQPRLTAASGFEIEDVIQTDVALDPGNSGGPLLDAQGRVIGINSQIATRDGDGGGTGFAVPVDTVKRIVPQLEHAGHVERAYLGIQGATAPDGVRVGAVQPGSPAATAGVHEGYVLERLAGETVRSMDDVSAILAEHAPGDAIAVEVRSGGLTRALKATLADRPAALPSE